MWTAMVDTPPSTPRTAHDAPSGAAATLQQLSCSLTAAARSVAGAERRRDRRRRAPDLAGRQQARGAGAGAARQVCCSMQKEVLKLLLGTSWHLRVGSWATAQGVPPSTSQARHCVARGPTFAGRPAVQRGARPPEQARRQAGRGRQAQPRLCLPPGDAPEVAPGRRRAARARDIQRVHGELLARGAPSAMPAAGAGLSAPGAATASPAVQARVPAAPHGRLRLPGAFSACTIGRVHARVSGGCCAVLGDAGGPSVASRKGVRCDGAGHGLRLPRP